MFITALALFTIATDTARGFEGSESGGFTHVESAATLESTSGMVRDAVEGPWIANGIWTLSCGDVCADRELDSAKLAGIHFDLAHVMLRADRASSHAHSSEDFVAAKVSVDDASDTTVIHSTISRSSSTVLCLRTST